MHSWAREVIGLILLLLIGSITVVTGMLAYVLIVSTMQSFRVSIHSIGSSGCPEHCDEKQSQHRPAYHERC